MNSKKEPSKIRDQDVSARMEMSFQKKNLEKAHVLFYKGFKAMGGNESKINGVFGKFQIRDLQEKAGISNLISLVGLDSLREYFFWRTRPSLLSASLGRSTRCRTIWPPEER